jgi:GNAT superfamily N-acetyltransferase
VTEALPRRRERLAVTVRPARSDDLPACAVIFRTAINDYTRPLGQIEVPADPGPVTRLWAHTRSTDPERFVVAATDDDRIVAFGSAVLRERLWFLSMLFVLPEAQGSGVGREILTRILPVDRVTARATATDSAQPISNALYALHDIVPRMPLLNLTGLPIRPEAFGRLPPGVAAIPFDEIDGGPAAAATDGIAGGALRGELDTLDRELLGAAHPDDHAWLRGDGRRGWLYRGEDGHALGYGYGSEAGRLGPVAARDPGLVAPILGHLTSAVVPRGAFTVWIGGPADRALVATLQAGFRLEAFPVLLCWDRPFGDFTRYLPISPGLL